MSKSPPFSPLYAGIRHVLPQMLDNYAAAVYLAVLSRRGEDGQCNPSVKCIADDLGIARERTVQLALKRLEGIGAIVRRRVDGTSWQIDFPVLDIRHPGRNAQGVAESAGGGAKRHPGRNAQGDPGRNAPPKEESIEEESPEEADGAAPRAADAASGQAVEVSDGHTPTASADQPARSKRLTPEDREAIRKDLVTLAGWLAYGMPGVRSEPREWPKLSPTATNWFAHAVDADDVLEHVSPTATKLQVAAYAWYTLQALRVYKGLPIELPGANDLIDRKRADGGVLCGLYEKLGPAGATEFIRNAHARYNDIAADSVGLRNPPSLDVSYFGHWKVANVLNRPVADDQLLLDDDESGMEGLL